MRITGHHMMAAHAKNLAAAQEEVARLADQISSGKAVRRASDDPVAWAQARRDELRATLSRGRGDGLNLANDQLAETERALTTIGGAVAEARALAVQAANDSYGPIQRAMLATQVNGLFELALAAANSQDASGAYLLAGSQSATAPFDATGAYVGDASVRSIETSEGARGAASLAGTSLTAASGVDVLPALARLATALAADDRPNIALAIATLTDGNEQVSAARADIGAMAAVVREAQLGRGALEDRLTARISELIDVDVVAAATELAQGSHALEAAQLVSAKLTALLSPRR